MYFQNFQYGHFCNTEYHEIPPFSILLARFVAAGQILIFKNAKDINTESIKRQQ